MRKPIKIYFDQNHLSRMAEGLLNNENYGLERQAYDYLCSLVNDNKIVIYYSWCHIYEGIRYEGIRSDFVDAYCSIVEKLTQGNCIIFPSEIQNKELEIFLCEKFNITTPLSKENYPYGKNMEVALAREEVTLEIDPYSMVVTRLLEIIKTGLLTKEQEEKLKSMLANKNNLRQFLLQMTEKDVQQMREEIKVQFPGADIGIKNKEDFINFILGSKEQKDELARNVHEGVFTFRNLVSYYGKTHPKLKQLGHLFDKDYPGLFSLVKQLQSLHTILGRAVLKENELRESLVMKCCEGLDENVKKLSLKYNFNYLDAERLLVKSQLKEIKSLSAYIDIALEYYNKHKGELEGGREPQENDIMDIHHAQNLPYVDFYVTERFFYEVIKRLQNVFNVKVFNDLTDFVFYLQQK